MLVARFSEIGESKGSGNWDRSPGAWAARWRVVQPHDSGARCGSHVLRRSTDASDYSQQPTFVDP